jgi:hypothetical protein
MTKKYWVYEEPVLPGPPKDYRKFADEYRSFLIVRTDSDFILYAINTLEHGLPPRYLQGLYTTKERAKASIDMFLETERIKQQEKDKQ